MNQKNNFLYLVLPLKPLEYKDCIKVGRTTNLSQRFRDHGVYHYPRRILLVIYTERDCSELETKIKYMINTKQIRKIENKEEYFPYIPQMRDSIITSILQNLRPGDRVMYNCLNPSHLWDMKKILEKIENLGKQEADEGMEWEYTN